MPAAQGVRLKLSYDTGYRNLTHLVYVLCNIELNVDFIQNSYNSVNEKSTEII